MTIEPFEGKVADGRIFGRGACDTKGTGAAMLWALKEAVAERRLEVNVALLYTIDEEAGRSGVRAFVDHHLEGLGWRPAGVVVGEPTSLRMVTAHNGTVRWRIRTQGVAAHSSDPPQGRSAIRSMTIVMDALERQYIPTLDASHPLVGKAQCSVNLIRGGTLINVIPESCEIWLDRRTVPGEDGRAVAGAVESILERVRQQHTDLEVVQDPPTIEPALSPDLNREFASRIGRVLDSLDMASEAVGAKYGTHASSFASAGLPAIVLGPGQIAQAHSAQEYLTLDDLHRGVEVYRKLMLQPAAAWI
ncbi:MAG: M20/M25/M40 family metallo-hydrolase [Planctomycetales bacterium]|nr:M20/M25/M40 family metallo-hydrolase [Planctomycetales bacterium]NIM08363.1 M20/M25/M40 family metallo-hydrolase [Planctomycetales bacterium]NIN07839.1 M20/M25/M40 family metallo-hydrolase [Planctomycetales bacterium]NIN76967.1 M20/M25/M40 family metallo-hydrolase [Planctomycetales bacterium]NIO34151.1 M20/M25/M40 family metallo-hydrolase [Planctomycetales bacterium]